MMMIKAGARQGTIYLPSVSVSECVLVSTNLEHRSGGRKITKRVSRYSNTRFGSVSQRRADTATLDFYLKGEPFKNTLSRTRWCQSVLSCPVLLAGEVISIRPCMWDEEWDSSLHHHHIHVQENNTRTNAHEDAGSPVQSSPFIAGWGLEDETFAFQVRKIATLSAGGG